MTLHRLSLENFRQHVQTEVEFQSGMTAIVGPNGSGKSTLLEGVLFALYGRVRDTKETVRFHWSERKKFSATLEFGLDGRRYRVHRTSAEALLEDCTVPGAPLELARGLSDVEGACERLLGLSYEQFKNSFCAEQKGLAFLEFRTSAARQDELARMLGFDRLKQAEGLAKMRRSVLKERVALLGQRLADPESLVKEVEEASALLAAKQAEREARAAALAGFAEREAEVLAGRRLAEAWIKNAQERELLARDAEHLKTAARAAEIQAEEARKACVEREALQADAARYGSLLEQLKRGETLRAADRERGLLTAQAQEIRAELEVVGAEEPVEVEKIRAETRAAQAALAEAETALREFEKGWNQDLLKVQKELSESEVLKSQAEQTLHRFESTFREGKCPECGQPFHEETSQRLQTLREALQKAEARRVAARQEADRTSAPPTEREALERTLANARSEAEAAAARLLNTEHRAAQAAAEAAARARKRERLAALEARLAALPEGYDAGADRIAEEERARLEPRHLRFLALADAPADAARKEVAAREATLRLEAASERYRALRQAPEAAAFASLAEAEAAIEAHRRQEAERRAGAGELDRLGELTALAQKQRDATQARLEEAKTRRAELAEARAEEALHDAAAKELRQLRDKLNHRLRPDLAARASENLNLLTNGRYPVLELSEQFQPVLVEDGVPKPVISGGEEDVVALALRLALSELIQERQGRPMTLLILDEIFGSLDAERRQSVLDRLSALKPRFAQILVISHVEEIQHVADRCLFLERDPETRATRVRDGLPLSEVESLLATPLEDQPALML